ncbi:MAG: hypothetical protein WA906_04415, partial [Pacificimonas sp.]
GDVDSSAESDNSIQALTAQMPAPGNGAPGANMTDEDGLERAAEERTGDEPVDDPDVDTLVDTPTR